MTSVSGKSLKEQRFDFVCNDTVFKNPFVDTDKILTTPVRCRYVHGGFDDGTRFSFYFPVKKEDFTGRFFQYITPFPDSETSAQGFADEYSPIGFSISHGAYFVETNEGGKLDFNDQATAREATIGAYRANAACAEFSRYIARLIYDCPRPYGYCFGGSGGAYRTSGGMESTDGIWEGSVPFVMGSPQAIPNVFAVRMNALRQLRDKMDDIVDAVRPGGSGNPYETLTAEQRQVLQEVTRMGFPIKAWYGWKDMDAHGFLLLYRTIVMMDTPYFREDFWHKPGYLGYDNPPSLQRDHIQAKAVIRRIIGQQEAEQLGLVAPVSEADRGNADRAWAMAGSDTKEKPVAYEIDHDIQMNTLGGELVILSGNGRGQQLQITKAAGHYVALAPVNDVKLLASVGVGDTIRVDNSDWLAAETYYRHQVPTKDFYVWNQFRGYNDQPLYSQRPYLVGPYITMGAAGCLPTGKIHGKMILCCSAWDREAFAWQGDWYRSRVGEHLGDKADDSFRLWYTDRATHGEVDDATETVTYMTTLYQALLDLSDWVERGVEPSHTSSYQIAEGQVLLSDDAGTRGGIQPVVMTTIGDGARADVKAGEPVAVHVVAECPAGTGSIVKAEWCLDGQEYTRQVDLSEAKKSVDGSRVEFDTTVSFDKAGTYFPTVRVFSERNGDIQTTYTRIPNLGKVRVVVK